MEEGLSYEVLLDLLRAERSSNKMAPLPTGFWSQIRDLLLEMEADFREHQAKDAFSKRTSLARDQVIHARDAAQGIWALRERKLAMLAIAHEEGQKQPAGITPGEREIFEALHRVVADGRDRVFAGTAAAPAIKPRPAVVPAAPVQPGGAPAASPPAASGPPQPAAAPPVGPAMGDKMPPSTQGSQDAPGEAPPGPGQEADQEPPVVPAAPPVQVPSDVPGGEALVSIRALGDIPPFVGPDMQTYNLKEGDVAAVPPAIADLLAKRDKAVLLDA
ncbi:MAG: hypothetical protein ACPGQL_07805 [Thermoplasmatota archaeon]